MKVLLVRADGIGDALACAPLVAALRDAGHAIDAVLGTGNRSVFARRAFGAVHVLERIPWPRHGATPHSRAAALHAVRAARYDVALVASEELDAYEFARDARIAERVGYCNGWEKPFKTVRVRALVTQLLVRPASAARAREHEARTLFRLGSRLVRDTEPTRDPARLSPLVLDLPARRHGAVALQVSRKFERDGLDVRTYAALARELLVRGIDVLALGDDAEAVGAVARASGARAAGNLDVTAWKAAIGGARAVVTPDSGAAHVAGMLGVPCVDCFPVRATTAHDVRRWLPWAAPHRIAVLDRVRPPDAGGRALARDVMELLG